MLISVAIELAGDLGILSDLLCTGAAVPAALKRPGAGEVSIAVAQDAAALDQASADWSALEAEGGAATPFQSLALARHAMAAHLARGEHPRIVIAREAGRPAVVFPTVISRTGGISIIRFLGDPLIQYGDVIARADVSAATLEAAWRVAADPGAARLVMLRKVRADARIAPLLSREAAACTDLAAPFVDLAAASNLHARDRRELARCRRRLSDLGAVSFEVMRGADAKNAVREALALKRAWLAQHDRASAVIGNAVWEAALTALADEPAFHVARLRVAGRTAALEAGFVHGRTWFALIGTHTSEFAKAGPGNVLTNDLVGWCRQQGLASYDLLAPADAYKTAITHKQVAVRDYAALLFGPRRLGILAARTIPLARNVVDRLPVRFRRRLLGVHWPSKL